MKIVIKNKADLHLLANMPAEEKAKVTVIDACNVGLTNLPANIFAGFKNLKKLYFSSNKIKDLSSDIFAGLAYLKKLDFSDNKIKKTDKNR